MNDESSPRGFLDIWKVATRPFALPASTISVLFGTTLACTVGQADPSWWKFLLAMMGMAALHTGANLLNDVYDFKRGLDREVTPMAGAVVRGWLTTRQALAGAWCFMGAGVLAGLVLVAVTGWWLAVIGVVGVLTGFSYSCRPLALKYRALGDLAVFLDFGVLGSLGAWTVQTGSPSWLPAILAVPLSLLVVGILHANNWRDMSSDRNGGISTVAMRLGDRGSEWYYRFLVLGPFAFVAVAVLVTRLTDRVPRLPLALLAVVLVLPLALKLIARTKSRHASPPPVEFLALDGATGQLVLAFGAVASLALVVDASLLS